MRHIRVGDLVYKVRHQGALGRAASKVEPPKKVGLPGLVMEMYEEAGDNGNVWGLCVPQFRVRFPGEVKDFWFHEHDLANTK